TLIKDTITPTTHAGQSCKSLAQHKLNKTINLRYFSNVHSVTKPSISRHQLAVDDKWYMWIYFFQRTRNTLTKNSHTKPLFHKLFACFNLIHTNDLYRLNL